MARTLTERLLRKVKQKREGKKELWITNAEKTKLPIAVLRSAIPSKPYVKMYTSCKKCALNK